MKRLTSLLIIWFTAAVNGAFVHPGIYHNATNIAEIKAKSTSTNAKWSAAWTLFINDQFTSTSYTPLGPYAIANYTGGSVPDSVSATPTLRSPDRSSTDSHREGYGTPLLPKRRITTLWPGQSLETRHMLPRRSKSSTLGRPL